MVYYGIYQNCRTKRIVTVTGVAVTEYICTQILCLITPFAYFDSFAITPQCHNILYLLSEYITLSTILPLPKIYLLLVRSPTPSECSPQNWRHSRLSILPLSHSTSASGQKIYKMALNIEVRAENVVKLLDIVQNSINLPIFSVV